ncbi:septum formation initiator family protein [Clostridium sporogenes]|uniref:Septum formation initiator family protein n=1 Tax=Clostridium botulinum TaxID=1491 RepID=A0A6M0T123_CLOBO|nr:septum formation initiator family protein [Clostridium sporogenes]NFA61194.1 septum formation initiator family protein [Clostridium botulinum]NFI75036.1 septum formation initiator family protein [Clostridium sporogenes]NFL71972.1 septum formation initiator family protein [Clostridium sporogenes]NFM25242.1 septum formation initiator family protein [Clostridium sporogenes]NFP63229.1 septum formation initiator family protein [Clostridium sporogenes]
MKKINVKKLIFFLAIVYVGVTFVNQQITMHKIRNQISEKEIELKEVKEKNQKLQDEVKLSKSKDYIEKLARERLRLIKKGETPVINNTQ